MQPKPEPLYKPNPVTGWFHFQLPSGRTFAQRKPKLSDLKSAAQLAGPSTRNETFDNLRMNEQISLLLLTEVDGKPINYEQAVAAGGLEGLFEDLQDCQEVMRIAAELKGSGAAVPLEPKP